MKCSETRELINAYIDQELDLVHSLDIEKHMAECPACTITYKNLGALRLAINTDSLYYHPPADYQKRIQKKVLKKNRAEAIQSFLSRNLVGVGTFALVASLIILVFIPALSDFSSDNRLTDEIVSSHIRSLMADHQTDVTTSDRHTVKPWFNGKLDFSPEVQDFADRGYALVGGRLDYLDERAVASLVYRHKRHLINLYIWPSDDAAEVKMKYKFERGYNLINWSKAGMTYWAVSDINSQELEQFAKLLQDQT